VKYWTVAEARAFLPRVRELVTVIQASALVASRASGNGHGHTQDDARAALAELEAESIVVRDPEAGLIDFPAKGADGIVYLLCYRLDEHDLEWWHLPDDGFAGRQPLPRDPE
jgi:hypothetical protein